MIKLYPTAIGVDALHAPCLACLSNAEHGLFVFYPVQYISTYHSFGIGYAH